MPPTTRRPTTPGTILAERYLAPHEISIAAFARACGVSRKHMSGIVHGHLAINADMAARIAAALGPPRNYGSGCRTPSICSMPRDARPRRTSARGAWRPSHKGMRPWLGRPDNGPGRPARVRSRLHGSRTMPTRTHGPRRWTFAAGWPLTSAADKWLASR